MTPDERAVLSGDTSYEAEARQVAIWRSLSSVDIAAIINGASQTARTLALAGLRARHPEASEKDLVPLFALLTLGPDLARKAYPELRTVRSVP